MLNNMKFAFMANVNYFCSKVHKVLPCLFLVSYKSLPGVLSYGMFKALVIYNRNMRVQYVIISLTFSPTHLLT